MLLESLLCLDCFEDAEAELRMHDSIDHQEPRGLKHYSERSGKYNTII